MSPDATCKLCRESKPLTIEFWTADNRMPNGLRGSTCRECVKAYKRRYSKTLDHRHHGLKYNWGLGRDEFDAKLAAQGGGCAICGRVGNKKALNVDHDHSCCPGSRSCGKCVRDILCNWCNVAEGYLADPRIEAVKEYRRKWNAPGS